MSGDSLNGTTLATLEEVLSRIERLEMATALMASIVIRQALPKQHAEALQLFVQTVSAERRARETAAHLPEPDLD